MYRSKPDLTHDDRYRRRRRCDECVDGGGKARTWPTHEGLDVSTFERELAREGLTLTDLGLGAARPGADRPTVPAGALPRIVSWSEWFWSRT